ncbi:hypothetical protein [Leptospira interrogans]|uniref:hypothetical protein n=1 Tax=Leptospira interrogans TaxID=173 RepID=UPI0004AC4150|nr:hypothetical protein [Leptospira interrogans]
MFRLLFSKILLEFFLFLGLSSKFNDDSHSVQSPAENPSFTICIDKTSIFYILILFLFCFVSGTEMLGSEDKLENYKQIRKCSQKLESCLKKCN